MGTGVLRLLGGEVENRCVWSGPDSYSVIGEANTQPPGCKASAYKHLLCSLGVECSPN